jgi:hypothetical protein
MKMTMLDKDKKPMAGMEKPHRDQDLSSRPAERLRSVPPPKVEIKKEKIKVEAGDFECVVTTEVAGTKYLEQGRHGP